MATPRYIALLRGINVGGKSIIKMADLKVCLADDGFADIATYIQSGNVLFSARQSDTTKLADKMQQALGRTFKYSAPIVVLSQKQLKDVIALAPKDFGSDPASYRYDVIFLKEPLTSAEVIKDIPIKEGVDTVAAGPGVLYFSRLTSRATQSRISRIVSMPIYQNMTIRNWNTTSRLLALMEQRPA